MPILVKVDDVRRGTKASACYSQLQPVTAGTGISGIRAFSAKILPCTDFLKWSEFTGRSGVGQRMFTMGMRSCAIAVHFRPRGFALPLLVALPLVCPIPTHLLVHAGPLCLGKYTYSPLRISVWQVPGEGDPWEIVIVTPLYLHFAQICSLPALLSIGTYPPLSTS